MKNVQEKNNRPTAHAQEQAEFATRLKQTQEAIRNGTHDTKVNVLRDVRAALAVLDIIERDEEILTLVAARVEKSILSIKPKE